MARYLCWFAYAISLFILTPAMALAGEQSYTLTVATWGASTHPQVKLFARRFIQRVEQASHGRIHFRFYPDSQLVKEAFVSTAVPLDTIDIALSTMDGWSGVNNDVSITTTPLWTLSMQDARRELVPGRPLFEYLSHSLQKNGVRPIALFDIGPGVVTSDFSLRDPAAMKGKVIRSVSKGTAAMLKGLGAAPVVMSVGDVYFALQSHTVDGAIGGLQGAYGLRHYEVAKYVMATNDLMGTFVHGYFMNEAKFESLPADLQAIIQNAATQTRNEAEDNLIKTYPDYLQRMVKGGCRLFNPQPGTSEWQAWKDATRAFRGQSLKRYDPRLIALMPGKTKL